MRRADRLFQIVQQLRRRRRATTAAVLAERLQVSERTIYRDIADLVSAGTPIEGEAGVGYRLRPGYDLPPLMFDREEIQALVLGARLVRRYGDAALAKASESILAKAAAVLPPELEPLIGETRLFAPSRPAGADAEVARLGSIREALAARRVLDLAYRTPDGSLSTRVVRPLGLFFWGRHWLLAGWCELREDFRNFRLDRVERLDLLDRRFADEAGRTLADMLARYGPAALKLLD